MTAGTEYEKEIREQPDVLRRLLERGRPNAEALAARIRDYSPTYCLVAARGSSDNAARYTQYLLGIHNALTVGLAVPSVFTLYSAAPSMKGALVIGISQSGQSPDVVSVVTSARRQGCATVAFTNDPASPLALASEHCIPLLAGEERAVAATKTYTAQLMAVAMVSAALEGNETRWRELAKVPDYAQKTIELNAGTTPQEVAPFLAAERLLVIGRGFNYSTAHETSLKLKELNYVVAEPYSAADLFHGPAAMISNGFPILLISVSGKTLADATRVLELVKRRGARLIAISDAPELLQQATVGLRVPSGMEEWVSPIPTAIAGQLLAGSLARANGLDPDHPRGLSKVTLTR